MILKNKNNENEKYTIEKFGVKYVVVQPLFFILPN